MIGDDFKENRQAPAFTFYFTIVILISTRTKGSQNPSRTDRSEGIDCPFVLFIFP